MKMISPKFSFKGWNYKKLLLGNWSTIKELIKAGIPCLLTLSFITSNPWLVAPLSIIGKQLLDICQYWLKNKTK